MAFITETRVSRQPTQHAQKRLMVAVRIRPHYSKTGQARILHSVDDKVIVVEDAEVAPADVLRQNRGSDKQFVFDTVFDENASQEKVYDVTTRPLISDVLQGYNATVFAYGATGSGKTHTMLGTAKDPGIMVRALDDLFMQVRSEPSPESLNVTMSYLEIYNENIRDLLNPSSGHLELREDNKEKTVQVVNLSEVFTSSTEEVMRLLQKGNKARTMEATAANKTSSRSHALLSVTVRHATQMGDGRHLRARVRQGKLFVIDLAGSERASQTNNRGRRLVEGGHINRSLLALGNCINALSGGARYVNYRDSKLTRLLKDALSGNSQTCMIAHVNPASAFREESKNTLLYADRAKTITNKVGQNVLDISYHVSQYRTIISELRDEITRLKTKMVEHRNEPPLEPVNINRLPRDVQGNQALGQMLHPRSDGPLRELKNDMVHTFKEQMKLRRKLLNIESRLLSMQMEIERHRAIITEWEGRNNRLYSGKYTAETRNNHERENRSGDSTVDEAWDEILFIETEQEKLLELKTTTERELEACKERAANLEKGLPNINSDDEREVLRLMVRVHELEVEKIELQSERILKQHELRQRDLAILRYDRQRQICEEIITRQRKIMEDGRLALPPDLQALYQMYQQEIHNSSYSDSAAEILTLQHSEQVSNPGRLSTMGRERKFASAEQLTNRQATPGILPPIGRLYSRSDRAANVVNDNHETAFFSADDANNPPDSSGSDWITSPLPASNSPYPASPGLPPPDVLFPPLSKMQETRYGFASSRLPRPIH